MLALGLWGCFSGCKGNSSGLCYLLISGVKGEADLVLISMSVALLRGLSRLRSAGLQSWLSLAQVIPTVASPLSWMQQPCWESSALYLFLSILNVAGSSVKCVIKFVHSPPTPKKKKSLRMKNCLELSKQQCYNATSAITGILHARVMRLSYTWEIRKRSFKIQFSFTSWLCGTGMMHHRDIPTLKYEIVWTFIFIQKRCLE